MNTRISVVALVLLMCLSLCSHAEIDQEPMTVKIGYIRNAMPGHYVEVPVVLSGCHERALHGFSFLIGYPSELVTLVSVEPGGTYHFPFEYEWETFTYEDYSDSVSGSGCPSGLVMVKATLNARRVPLGDSVANDTTLFTIKFLTTNDRTYTCWLFPITFVWMGCLDNSISYYNESKKTDGIYVADHVHTIVQDTICGRARMYFEQVADSGKFTGFPTVSGFQSACLDSLFLFTIVRGAEYYNGGIHIPCLDIDDCGDVNFNGIAFEIADVHLFVKSLLYGNQVFTITIEGQIAGTDYNHDCVYQTMNDLQYLIRCIVGDAVAYNHLDTCFTGKLSAEYQDGKMDIISSFTEPVGALYMKISPASVIDSGGITFDSALVAMETKSHIRDDTLYIVWYSLKSEIIPADCSRIVSVPYTGGQKPSFTATASGYYGEPYELILPDKPMR